MKGNYILVIGVPEKEEREQGGIQNLCEEKVAEDFPNMVGRKDAEVHKVQIVPNKMNPKRPTEWTGMHMREQ